MSVVKGLKNINALLDKPKSDGPKVRWLKLADGQSAKIRFIEELDEDSANYNADRGLALVVKEHVNPKDYKRKAVDTIESEGRDWAEEMHRKDPKAGWRARLRFYCNVLVDDGIESHTLLSGQWELASNHHSIQFVSMHLKQVASQTYCGS